MNIHIYLPAVITFVAGVIGLLVGPLVALANYGDDRPGPSFWFYTGILGFYGGIAAILISIGMQIVNF